jgi:hypothetical protein
MALDYYLDFGAMRSVPSKPYPTMQTPLSYKLLSRSHMPLERL